MLDMAARLQAQTQDDALRELMLDSLPAARRLATYILRDPMAAEDAVQEAALHAWDHRSSLRDADAVKAWFNRILVNTCRQELRRRARKPTVVEMDSYRDDGANRLFVNDELGRAIRRLAPEEQLLLALRYGRDMTVPQISELTNIRQGSVKSRLHAAHQHLRAILEADRRLEEVQP
jgi:RNA polymerase sigma-70 factor (ECF subfamily)